MPSRDVPAERELAGSLGFYDRAAGRAKLGYQTLRILTLLLAAAIPVIAALDGSAAVTASFGAAIVVVEGLQQLFQFHERWVGYRNTWNALERERRLYEAEAGPYARTDEPARLLSERMEGVMESETADWASTTYSDKTEA